MHGVTGKAGTVTIAAGAFNSKITGWTFVHKAEHADETGAGDTFKSRTVLHGDWECDIEARVPDQVARHFFQANETTMTAGTTIAFTLKFKSGDTNAYIAATGIAESLRVENPYDGPAVMTAHIICSEGVAPTVLTASA